MGWAIEGAIGSELKIDATYLSPHVEMSDRLEASSKIFAAKLNMSHWLLNLASPGLKQYTQPIAYIRAEGVSTPFTVHTYDVTDNVLGFGRVFCAVDPKTRLQQLVDWSHPEFAAIQKGLDPAFKPAWLKAYDLFVKGDWPAAKAAFAAAVALKPGDGPAAYLLKFMESQSDTVPATWDGAHFLEGF